jgi:heat shock protein HslJ
MRFSTAIAGALMIGCATPALAQDAPYRAAGTEPFWSLTIDSRMMTFQAPGKRTIEVATPRVINGFAGEIYQTRRMNVNVIHTSCTDGMSDRTWHDRVTVMLDGKRYEGCGGMTAADTQPPPPVRQGPDVAALDGSAWRIVSVDGVRVATARPTSIRFSNGRVEGNAGCNSFGGDYRQAGIRLETMRIISTKMACVGPGMAIEGKVFGILTGPSQLTYNRDATLTVSGAGSRMTLARKRWAR